MVCALPRWRRVGWACWLDLLPVPSPVPSPPAPCPWFSWRLNRKPRRRRRGRACWVSECCSFPVCTQDMVVFFWRISYMRNLSNTKSIVFCGPWDMNTLVTRWCTLCVCKCVWGKIEKVPADENTLCLQQSLSRGVIEYRHTSVFLPPGY